MNTASTARRIEQTLRDALSPTELHVEDESHLHAGHAGAASGGGHFRVRICAEAFRHLGLVARHRRVYAALAAEMGGAVHALAIDARAPGE